jgi:enoyl-CoA hydratase
MSGAAGIRLERRGRLGLVVLDRPKALNALTHDMVRSLSLGLLEWRDDPEVLAVLVKAVPGRAFCAGGDVREIVELCGSEGVAAAARFYRDEYRMNWRIRHYPKPWVALLDGITMGGGVGISVHGSHCVATENTLFAMPETGIGLFPDVGGTWFLPRCPGRLGIYLGLTGARLGPADCVHAGIATHYVPRARLQALEPALAEIGRAEDVDNCLAAVVDDPGEAPLAALRPRIDACYGGATLAEIEARLVAEPSGWGAEQLGLLASKSPLSLRVTFEQLRRGAALAEPAAAFRLEYRVVQRFLASGELAEGVRALLVDKDRRPRWRHARTAEVTEAEVEGFFAPLPEGELELDWQGL